MKSNANPFITTGYSGPKYFCDREKETRDLLENLLNGNSVTLTAIRRMGKTGLIKHVLSQLKSDWVGIYIDILPTENLNDFLNVFTSALLNAVPEKSGPGRRIMEFIKSLRPVIGFDPLTGNPMVTIDTRSGEANRQIERIFDFLEDHSKGIIIAIDEFQQILNYPEQRTDAWLRSVIQSLNNVHFIFAGSQQHLMNDIFMSPSRPFFRSTSFMRIGKINHDAYLLFIMRHFKKAGKMISKDSVNEMLDWADLHTYYVQLLCNRVFASNATESNLWKQQAQRILDEQEIIFFKYRDLLSSHQWQLLKSIAHEGKVFEPTSKYFVQKYKLGSPTTVFRALQSLQKKEMIYSDYDNGRMFYSVYDVLFRRWIGG